MSPQTVSNSRPKAFSLPMLRAVDGGKFFLPLLWARSQGNQRSAGLWIFSAESGKSGWSCPERCLQYLQIFLYCTRPVDRIFSLPNRYLCFLAGHRCWRFRIGLQSLKTQQYGKVSLCVDFSFVFNLFPPFFCLRIDRWHGLLT